MEQFTIPGMRHRREGIENQDAVYAAGSVGTLADGVSACGRAGAGARRTSQTLAKLLRARGERLAKMPAAEAARLISQALQYELAALAAGEQVPPQEYSSTAMGAVFSPAGELLTCNLGDGVILGVKNSGCEVLSGPGDSSAGCPCTTDHQAARYMQVKQHSNVARVLLCSDGAWPYLFDRDCLRMDAEQWLLRGDGEAIASYLQSCMPQDDCSFVLLERQPNDLKKNAKAAESRYKRKEQQYGA